MSIPAWSLINYSLLTIGAFLSLISSFILLRGGKWRLISNVLLAFYLFGLGLACCMVFLTTSGLIKGMPWLYRLPSPIYYAMFPAGYLYVATLLDDRNHLYKGEWLFFMPAFIHFIEMLPFYLRSNAFKLDYLNKTLDNPFGPFFHSEGWLPVYTHNMLRGVLGLISGVGILYWLIKIRKSQPRMLQLYPGLYNWLWVFGLMMLIFAGAVFFTFYQGGHWKYPALQSLIMTFCFSISLIISTTVLLLYPTYLYGMPRIRPEKIETVVRPAIREVEPEPTSHSQVQTSNVSHQEVDERISDSGKNRSGFVAEEGVDPGLLELYENYRQRLDWHMKTNQPFLQQNYKISDLARELHIPQHHLTVLLNKVMQMRFNDYINQCRIAYIKQLVDRQGLTHSLEGFATMAGFSNRVTFTRAVQRATGTNPSQYFSAVPPKALT